MTALGKTLKSLLDSESSIANEVDSISSVTNLDKDSESFIVFYLDGLYPVDDNDVFGGAGEYMYRIMLVHEDFDKIESLQTSIIDLLSGFEGVNNGNDIQEIRCTNARDDWAEELMRFVRYIHFTISVNE